MQLISDTDATLNPEDDYTMEDALSTNIPTQYAVNIALLFQVIKPFVYPISHFGEMSAYKGNVND